MNLFRDRSSVFCSSWCVSGVAQRYRISNFDKKCSFELRLHEKSQYIEPALQKRNLGNFPFSSGIQLITTPFWKYNLEIYSSPWNRYRVVFVSPYTFDVWCLVCFKMIYNHVGVYCLLFIYYLYAMCTINQRYDTFI